jgi:hypothetical protein
LTCLNYFVEFKNTLIRKDVNIALIY